MPKNGDEAVKRAAQITKEFAAAVDTWRSIPHGQRCFAEQNAVRVVVVKTDRKLRSINEWKERFDVAYAAICGVVGKRREPREHEEDVSAIRAATDALDEAYSDSS